MTADATRIATICLTGTYSKRQLVKMTGWAAGRVQKAIDECKQERTIVKAPFFGLWENGSFTYGYRHRLYEVRDNLVWNMKYLRSRSRSTEYMLRRALTTKDTGLRSTISSKQRTLLQGEQAIILGQIATFERLIDELEHQLI